MANKPIKRPPAKKPIVPNKKRDNGTHSGGPGKRK